MSWVENTSDEVDYIIDICKLNGNERILDLVCGDYAEAHFPVKLWEAGEKSISLSEFDWDPKTRIMMFGNQDFAYGEAVSKPDIAEGAGKQYAFCLENGFDMYY